MRFLLAIVALVAAVGVSVQAHPVHNNNNNGGSESHDFDYLILRQIWPATSCMFPGQHTCKIGDTVNSWVVHGLWPSIKSEIGPQFCNRSLPFNFDNIKWLLPQLLEYWPNLYTNTPLESFWQHEWEKHGTCALGLPQVTCESDYFNVSLNLRTLYDFGPVLKSNGIVPDDTNLYNLNKIELAVTSVLGVKPLIVCDIQKDSDVQYLSQMQVCVSKELKLVDCAFKAVEPAQIMYDNAAQETQCNPALPVHYPVIKH